MMSAKKAERALTEYLAFCQEKKKIPTLPGFSAYLNMGISAYRRFEQKHPECADRISTKLEAELWDSGMSPTLIGAYLKAYGGGEEDKNVTVVFEKETRENGL